MKKGFTLVELIMVITLLGIIALITVPAITKSINSSKEEAYKEQKKLIVNAAKQYVAYKQMKTEVGEEMPLQNGTGYCVNVSTLKSAGFLSKEDIKDPKSKNASFDGSIVVTATAIEGSSNFKYAYTYSDSKCS